MRSASLALIAFVLGGIAVACASPSDSPLSDDESALQSDASSSSDGGVADPDASDGGMATSDAGSTVTFSEIEPILAAKCISCHHHTGDFSTLDDVKSARSMMVSKISSGRMPKNDPTWRTTADGVEVLDYLRTSPELQ